MNTTNIIRPSITRPNPTVTPTPKSTEKTTPKPITKKEFQKLLTDMMIALAIVLSEITGNSLEEIDMAVGRAKLYAGFIELLQGDLQGKLDAIQKAITEQTKLEIEDKTMSWVMFGSAMFLMIIGGISAATGVGVGLGATAIAMGASMLVSSSLEVFGAIDAMDTAIDEGNTINGVLNEKKSAEEKIGAKMGILALLTLLSCGVGALGNSAAKTAELTVKAGLQASKATKFAAQFAMGATKTAKAASIMENLVFIGLNGAATLNMTEDIIVATTPKGGTKSTDSALINTILMITSIVFGLARGKINKLGKSIGKKIGKATPKKPLTQAQVKAQMAPVLRDIKKIGKIKAKAEAKAKKGDKTKTKVKTTAKPTSTTASNASSNDNINLINRFLRALKKNVIPKSPLEALLSFLRLAALITTTYAGFKSGSLKIDIGNLDFQVGNLLLDVASINATETLIDDMLTANDDFVKTLNSFVNKIQNLLRTSAENPAGFITYETQFARTLAQAV